MGDVRLIDFDQKKGLLWLTFKYDETVLNTVKSITARSYDEQTKRWCVPIAYLAEAIEKLEPLHFKYTPRFREYWATKRDELPQVERTPDPPSPEEDDGAYTVSRLNAEARNALVSHFPKTVLLEAEISGWDRNRKAGHAYFELVERVAKGTDPIAKISAVCFGGTRQSIAGKLRRVGHELKDGQRVRFFVRPEIYSQGGRFQVVIEDIDTEFVVDQALKRRDVVLAHLRDAKLTEKNLRVAMPICPLRIGLVTAPDTDGYADFTHELETAPYNFEVVFAPARMQGHDASPSIARALKHLSTQPVDVIAIVRGGGAKLSLADLDTIEIATAVCTSPVKVVCGIGHHRDKGVLDVIARSEKTPTAAAQSLVRRVEEFLAQLGSVGEQIGNRARFKIDHARRTLAAYSATTERRSLRVLSRSRIENDRARQRLLALDLSTFSRDVQRLETEIEKGASRKILNSTRRLNDVHQRLMRVRFTERFAVNTRRVEGLATRLDQSSRRVVNTSRSDVDQLESLLRALSPDRIRDRGFAILRDEDGTIVVSASSVDVGQALDVQLRDGTLKVRVEDVTSEG